jgi:uncharacterized membrane protein
MAPNSLFAFGFSFEMIREYAGLEWVSLITLFYAFLFLSMAAYLTRTGRRTPEAITVLLAKAALFLIVTVPIILSNYWITVFWAAQALGLLWMGRRLDRPVLTTGAYLLQTLAIAKFLGYDYQAVFHLQPDLLHIRGSYTYLILGRFSTYLALLATTGGFAWIARRDAVAVLTKDGSDGRPLTVLAGLLLFVFLNVETASFFHDVLPAAGFAALSVLWACVSACLAIIGFRKESAAVRRVSLGLFAVTIAKVFLFDMSRISTPYRIISFIILGLMLVGTSYLYHTFRGKALLRRDKSEGRGGTV